MKKCLDCKNKPVVNAKKFGKMCAPCFTFEILDDPKMQFEWLDNGNVIEFKAPSKTRLLFERIKSCFRN